jgi:hypothetical protein
MTFADRLWTLERFADAPDFCQRYSGTFADDGNTIDGGSHWEHDFALSYTRVR